MYANKDFVESFASKFRPLLMTPEVKLLQVVRWGRIPNGNIGARTAMEQSFRFLTSAALYCRIETPGVTRDEDKILRIRTGWSAGLAAEVAFAPDWSARLEYLYDRFRAREVRPQRRSAQ